MAVPGVHLMMAFAAFLWGANFNLSHLVLTDLHPLTAAAARFVLAAVLLAVLLRHQTPLALLRRHWRAYLLVGMIGVAGFNVLFFLGMSATSAVNGALIMASNPLLTALLAWIGLGESLTRRQILAVPLAFAGVALVVAGGGGFSGLNRGDLLMLGANLCWAFYNVLARRLLPAGTGMINSLGVLAAGAVVLAVICGASNAPLALPGPGAGLALAAMVTGGTVLAYGLWNRGLARLGAGQAALYLNLVPVTSMGLAAWSGQVPDWTQVLGGLLTVGAVLAAAGLGPTARGRVCRA